MINQIRKATVCFLRKNDQILLALIEYSPTKKIWNGIGGWSEIGETVEDGVIREISEETFIQVEKNDLKKVISDYGDIHLNVFLADRWSGELKIREPSLKELKWFSKDKIPYSQMFPGVDMWLPKVLEGKLLKNVHEGLEEITILN